MQLTGFTIQLVVSVITDSLIVNLVAYGTGSFFYEWR